MGIMLENVAGYPEALFTDERGATLYEHVDGGGAPTGDCNPDCNSDRLPALAEDTASLTVDWAVRTVGTARQWVYRGAALYRYNADLAIGDVKGKSDAWRPALYRPDAGIELRTGIDAREINDAGGTVLVDSVGLTLYVLTGNGGVAPPAKWVPLQAPAIARPSADFNVINRSDGISQWAYRGQPLYRFDEDTKPLDVFGVGVDPNFSAALIRSTFRPSNIEIRRIPPLGDILTTVDGAVIYQRDRVSTVNEGHDFREDHGSAALGRSLGTATCATTCTATWHPLLAPPQARPCGYWSVVTRPEGTRQWVYKGFALYTYLHDMPGTTRGNEMYDFARVQPTASSQASLQPTSGSRDDGLPVEGVPQRVGGGLGAFFWHAVVP